MAQYIQGIDLTVEGETVQVSIHGDNGSRLSYSGSGVDGVSRMFEDMRSGLRRDMDSYEMVPSGYVEESLSDSISDWSGFSAALDDLYLGNHTDYVEEWRVALCDQVDTSPVAYVSEISISTDDNRECVYIDFAWDSSADNWNKFGLETPNGQVAYASNNYSTFNGMLGDIAETWGSDFQSCGIAYERDPALQLPTYGPDIDAYTITNAFRNLWEGYSASSDVEALKNYLDQLLNSTSPGAFVACVEIDVNPYDKGDLVMCVSWDTYRDPAWNALVPSTASGNIEYHSNHYGSIQNMFVILARDVLPEDLRPEVVEYNPNRVNIRYSAVEGPVITESELNSALKDLFDANSLTSNTLPVADKLEQMLIAYQSHPLTGIVYNFNEYGGDLTFNADDFELRYSINDPGSVLRTFEEIAGGLARECDSYYVYFDPDNYVDITPGYNNEVDIASSNYGNQLLDIFYDLYDGRVTQEAENLAQWIRLSF